MPSSGARSGTRPSRSERGAGDGKLTPLLTCGHRSPVEPVVIYPSGKRLYSCPRGCAGLLERAKSA